MKLFGPLKTKGAPSAPEERKKGAQRTYHVLGNRLAALTP
jgi:hypothetical protein